METEEHKALQHYAVQCAVALSKETAKTQALLAGLELMTELVEKSRPLIEDDETIRTGFDIAIKKARAVMEAVKHG